MPRIIRNELRGNGEMGIVIRMESSPVIEDNEITDNPVGVLVSPGAPCPTPDLGGGGRSHGGNVFANDGWDLENHCRNAVMATGNNWSHSPRCDAIDHLDVSDDEENPLSGAVNFGFCVPPIGR